MKRTPVVILSVVVLIGLVTGAYYAGVMRRSAAGESPGTELRNMADALEALAKNAPADVEGLRKQAERLDSEAAAKAELEALLKRVKDSVRTITDK